MGTLQVDMFVTLDGVIQAPGAPDEDGEGGFKHGGWQAPFFDEESGKRILDGIQRFDALLLGRKTYEIFADYWPKAPAENPIAAKLNRVPKYVASRTLESVDWKGSTLIKGDVADEVPRIKQKHREVHVIGSGDLVQTLLKHGLVDRLNLWVYPLVLGAGKRLFEPGAAPTALRLIESKAFGKGAVLLTYEPAGKPTYGSMETVDAERAA